jgi:hypothetical protein
LHISLFILFYESLENYIFQFLGFWRKL